MLVCRNDAALVPAYFRSHPPAPAGRQYDPAEVQRALHDVDPELAGFWKKHGNLTAAPLPGRPSPDQARPASGVEQDAPGCTTGQAERAQAQQRAALHVPAQASSTEVADEIFWQARKPSAQSQPEPASANASFQSKFAADQADRHGSDGGGEATAEPKPKPAAKPTVLTFRLDPENLPWEKTRELIRAHEKAGTLVERYSDKYRKVVQAYGIPLELADGTKKLMVIEFVPVSWWKPLAKPRYRLAGIAPVTVNPQAALDVFVFDRHHIKGAQQTAAVLEFALHIIPLGGATDYASRGQWGEAVISIASDAAMVATGGASKAITATAKGQKILRVSGATIEGSIAVCRAGQGAYKLYNGAGGYGEVGEALLRLFGVKVTLSKSARRLGTAAKKYQAIADAGGVSIPKERAWQAIDQLRSKAKGFDALGSVTPVRGDKLGTVAMVHVNGRNFFGVNSSRLSDQTKNLGREVFAFLKGKGVFRESHHYGDGLSHVLTHAEGHSLMRAWKGTRGKLSKALTLFVDREPCSICKDRLPDLARALGIEKLTVMVKNGKVFRF